jgi:hypothetical protein
MAHRVVWEIDDVPDRLVWRPLKNPDRYPLLALSELGAEQPLPGRNGAFGAKTGYRLRIFHTTEDGLPPNDEDGVLDECAVRQHFRHYYGLLRHRPKSAQLPHTPDRVKTFNCGVGQALLGE